jgi:CBS domain-containing protein
MFEDLIDQLAESDHARPDEQAIRDFSEACKRVDTDPRERQRIRGIAGLVDDDDLIYGEALAAVDRGDRDAAVRLLRRCADAGIGESAWLLATVLEDLGKPEATMWYLRAAREGDSRAEDKLAGLRTRPGPAPGTPGGNPPSSLTILTEGAGQAWTNTEMRAIEAARPLLSPRISFDTSAPGLDAVPIGFSGWMLDADRPRRRFTGVVRPEVTTRGLRSWVSAISCPAEDLVVASVQNVILRISYARLGLAHRDLKDLPWELLAPGVHAPGAVAPVLFCTESDWLDDAAFRLSWRPGTARIALLGAGRPGRPAAREETAADVMLLPESVSTLTLGTTVHDALEQMVRSGARALPVHDRVGVAGVITLADIAGYLYQARGLPSIQRVETLMQPPTVVPGDMPLSEVMTAAASDVTGLLIVTGEDGTPAGYLTHETLLAHAPSSAKTGSTHQPATRSSLLLPAGVGC